MPDESPPDADQDGDTQRENHPRKPPSSDLGDVVPVSIESELRQSFLGYAMSVIINRALPDVRDGLKPVHRRILYSMYENNYVFNRPYVKSARVSGEVMGKYHPHGEGAIYDTMVRMAQSWSLRYMLLDGQGNFGSIDNDPPAAQRYTEVRMQRIASSLLADIEMATVEFSPNYDETLTMPDVLPTRVPNLLVNGAHGIAVGMATNIPPHNLGEVTDACLALIEDPSLEVDDLLQHVRGPDFPTGAIINGRAGSVRAYRTGRGSVVVRARAEVKERPNGREYIEVTEIPYQTNKAQLIEKIAELVKLKKLSGIRELRDESDKLGLSIVIETRKDFDAHVVLNNLYHQTRLQSTYGINCVALVNGQPRTLNLKQMLVAFLNHRRDVVIRRAIFELARLRARGHVLEGQLIALENIDQVVDVIRKSATPDAARLALMEQGWPLRSESKVDMASGGDEQGVEAFFDRVDLTVCRPKSLSPQLGYRDGRYYLSEEQARAILDMTLRRLTGLEKNKIIDEYEQILSRINELEGILASSTRLDQAIRDELIEIKEQFGDERRTEIRESQEDLSDIDLIAREDKVVTVSHRGYAKLQSLNSYVAQGRGGRGKVATKVRDEDFVEQLLVANTHDVLLCFSDRGRVYWLRTFQIPEAGRTATGRPLVNLLRLQENEKITCIYPIREFEDERYVVMATALGRVKRTSLAHFARQRSNGLIALNLKEGDSLVGVAITDGSRELMLVSSSGHAIKFQESDVRVMGRVSMGVAGIRVAPGSRVISLIVCQPGEELLLVTEFGFGKRTPLHGVTIQRRRGKGRIVAPKSERNGKLVGALQVADSDEVFLITDQGTMIRTGVSKISSLGRYAQGVTLIRLDEGATLVDAERVVEADAEAAPQGDEPDPPEQPSDSPDAAVGPLNEDRI